MKSFESVLINLSVDISLLNVFKGECPTISMSSQEDETEIVDIKQNPDQKDYLSSIDFKMGHSMNNFISTSSLPQEKRRDPPRNFDELNYPQTVKTIKEIKSNFLEEHKYIINTYYLLYSNRLNEVLDRNLNNLVSIEKYSKTYRKLNRNLLDNQLNTTKIIDDIVVKNMDTFIKSIELVHKFYFDVLQSCYNYITLFKKESCK
jgi:hypothetical protein